MLILSSSGLDYIIMGLAPNLAWLLRCRILSGITGFELSDGARL